MLDNISLENVLFLDIETIPQSGSYEELDERFKKLWDRKSERLNAGFSANIEPLSPEKTYFRAGIYAEFGKIICICVGAMKNGKFHIKSFAGHDEHALLTEFAQMLNKSYSKKESLLCAHNGKEFDFPFIARRMLILGIKLPDILDLSGKKPWEVNHLDTMELWKFGDYKSYTSLDLLTAVFDIPSPKNDIDGSRVAEVYYTENNLPRIVEYCMKDVLALVQIFRRYRGEPLIESEKIVYI